MRVVSVFVRTRTCENRRGGERARKKERERVCVSEDECEREFELRMSAMRSVRKEGVGKFAPMGGNERGKFSFVRSVIPHICWFVIFFPLRRRHLYSI